MVGTQHFGINGSFGDPVSQTIRYDEIVDPPSGIIFPGIEPITPPAIGSGHIRVQLSEGIRKAPAEKISKGLPLLVREACISPVGAGVF